MQPLLKIQSIPIKIEAQTKRASFQYSTEHAPVSKPTPLSMINRGGTVSPQRSPVQITGNSSPQVDNAVQQRQAEYAVRNATQQAVFSNPSASQVDQSVAAVADTVIGQALMSDYAPASQPAAPVSTPSTSVNYNMDKPTFDWNSSSKPQLEFVPAEIKYTITQYPQVVIEYVGEPLYVPASANPNYKGTA